MNTILSDYLKPGTLEPADAFAPAISKGWTVKPGYTLYWHTMPEWADFCDAIKVLPQDAEVMLDREDDTLKYAMYGDPEAVDELAKARDICNRIRPDIRFGYYELGSAPSQFLAPGPVTWANANTVQKALGMTECMWQKPMLAKVKHARPRFYRESDNESATEIARNFATMKFLRTKCKGLLSITPVISHHRCGEVTMPVLAPEEFVATQVMPAFGTKSALWWWCGSMLHKGKTNPAVMAELAANVAACCEAMPEAD